VRNENVVLPKVDPLVWKLPTVLAALSVSRSSWLAGVKSGRYPRPVRLSERAVAWRAEDIRALVATL
jgi:prophage regulatory protein